MLPVLVFFGYRLRVATIPRNAGPTTFPGNVRLKCLSFLQRYFPAFRVLESVKSSSNNAMYTSYYSSYYSDYYSNFYADYYTTAAIQEAGNIPMKKP